MTEPSLPTKTRSLREASTVYPPDPGGIPGGEIVGDRYAVRYARTAEDLAAIQRLRFEVFNLELGEGLESSFTTGRDEDEFDQSCHHLMVIDRNTDEVIGTYRLQTAAMARRGAGFYTAGEFDLSHLPEELLASAIETGRACIAKEHRKSRVLSLLWKGLARYVILHKKRFLFGCCSLTSQDPNDGKQVFDFLVQGRFMHTEWFTRPLPEFACFGAGFKADVNTSVEVPPLFANYLKIGAKIAGRPALDRRFKTIDFLVILDIRDLSPQSLQLYFSR